MSESDQFREEVRTRLFNQSVSAEDYGKDKHHDHLLEQYKLYVEMADRISQRRAIANTFFVTINTAMIAALAGFAESLTDKMKLIPIAGILLCFVWIVLLRSYRNLNSAKFLVVGLLEERLPSSPFWHSEWYALGEGKNWLKHMPLGPIEIFVPLVYAALYIWLLL